MEQTASNDGQRVPPHGIWSTVVLTILLLAVIILCSAMLLWGATTLVTFPLVVVSALALFLLPGLAMLKLLWPFALDLTDRCALAVGLSCSVPPLLFLFANVVGLQFSSAGCWAALVVCGAIVVWPQGRSTAWRFPSINVLSVALVGLSGIAIVVRLYIVRDLPAGMFGDSVHHTMIAQLLVDHGGLFRSWEPYAPLTTFTYHYGFHSLVAWLTLLSGAPATQSLLIIGQVQSALVLPTIYLFAKRLTGSTQIGILAGIVAAFLSVMPAYYVNWGRYTQLAGQTLLPAVCVAWMALFDGIRTRINHQKLVRIGCLVALATAGLILTHYRVAVFAACFVIVYAVICCIRVLKKDSTYNGQSATVYWLIPLLQIAGLGFIFGGLAFVLVSPWLIQLREGMLLRIAGNFITQDVSSDSVNTIVTPAEFFGRYLSPFFTSLTLLGIVAAFARRQWVVLSLPCWALLVFAAANPYLFGVPGAGILTNFAVFISTLR